MVNAVASAPLRLQLGAGPSGSVEVAVYTTVAVEIPSVTVAVVELVTVGASFTAAMLIVLATVLEPSAPSLAAKVTVREVVEGLSELFEYCTARSATCHCARVAVAPAELRLMTPVPAL